MNLAWGNKVSLEFCIGIEAMVRRLGWNAQEQASDLMSCTAFESGETFSAQIRNKAGSGAVGLIQFMPSTATGLGTTVENLELLRPEAQLWYVEKYFAPYASRIHSLSDMYMAILLPSAIGKPGNFPLFSGSTKAFRQNSGLDADSNGYVTKDEATARVVAMRKKGMLPGYFRERNAVAA